MVITADSDSADPGSIPGTTFQAFIFAYDKFFVVGSTHLPADPLRLAEEDIIYIAHSL
jgi:hypothetical protein